MVTPPNPLLSLVYSSTATAPLTGDDLTAIVARSRENNGALQLTGFLLHRRGRFLQVLEGPERSLRERMAIIEADPRHAEVRTLVEESVPSRQFPDWTMEYEPYTAAVAAAIPGYEPVFAALDDANDASPFGEIGALREMLRWFRARAAQNW